MSPKSTPKSTKKRTGRKRQPPLAQGPPLQFVVASHPDQFKHQKTMRHVRSHVMYKHRVEQTGGSPTERSESRDGRPGSAGLTQTPSPINSDGALEENHHLSSAPRRRSSAWDGALYQYLSQPSSIDPLRNLAARIIAATTAEPARSATPKFEGKYEYPFPPNLSIPGLDSLHELTEVYLRSSNLFAPDDLPACRWMRMLCSNRMSFLSQMSVVCVYKDVSDGCLEDTPLTIYAKSKIMNMLTGSDVDTDDYTIISIVHLLVSEIGGHNEEVFDVHQDALARIVHQRGGIRNLGIDYYIATFLIIVLLTFTILRGRSEPMLLQGFNPDPLNRGIKLPRPISPLYAPDGQLSRLYGSCSVATFEIIRDMFDLTQSFLNRWSYPASEDPMADSHLEQIYTRLLYRPSTEDRVAPDWIYESCRIAALIYCRSIVQGMPLAQSANVVYAQSSGSREGTTVIAALHHAIEKTDRSSYWGPLCGVLLWVNYVGGAASWPSYQPMYGEVTNDHTSMPWIRKCFALSSVKTSLSINFDHCDAIVEHQRTMLQVQRLINLRRGGSR